MNCSVRSNMKPDELYEVQNLLCHTMPEKNTNVGRALEIVNLAVDRLQEEEE